MMAEYPANIVAIKISSIMIVISGTVRITEYFFCPHTLIKKRAKKKKTISELLIVKKRNAK